MKKLVILCSLIIVIMNLILWGVEPNLIFFPTPYPTKIWKPSSIKPIDIQLQTKDGKHIHAWYLPNPNTKSVILYFHGNRGNLTDRYSELVKLHDTLNATVMSFDYRGFGLSEGTPEEFTMIEDAEMVRLWLAKQENILPNEIILLGRSMGTGIAVNIASRFGAKSLLLISPFSSLAATVRYHCPIVAAEWLMHNPFNSIDKIKRYHGPVLILHGTADTTIPIEQAKQLYNAAPGKKQFTALANVKHYDPISDSTYQELKRFLHHLTR